MNEQFTVMLRTNLVTASTGIPCRLTT
jgi:hypothetical protein